MKCSIRIKYTIIITSVLFAVLLAVTLFMNFLLEPYVAHKKETEVKETITVIEEHCSDGWDNDDSFELIRLSMQNNYGISLYYVDGSSSFQVFSTNTNLETVRTRFETYIANGTVQADEVMEQTDSYILYRIFDVRMSGQQIECLGKTGNMAYIITTSMAGITESVKVVNTFFTWVAVIGVMAAAAVVYVVCGSLTRPIRSLAKQSEDIAGLDFSTRFKGKSRDEIGTLGNNMNQMSDRLEQIIRELKDANARLAEDIAEKEKINRMQKEFLGNVSHELKTPIALIQGYAEGLRDGIADDPESTDYYTGVIVDEANKMNTIVKRLLNLDEIESGRLTPVMEDFDLIDVIRGVLNSSAALGKDKQIKLKVISPENLTIHADEFMIEQVLTNYLSNAFHHVDDGGYIAVKAGTYSNGRIYVAVHNSGKNIPEEDLPRLWEKFFKVDKAHTRSYGGSGIGLSIVKTIIDLHGGDVSAENTEDGVTFGFVLPTHPAE